MQLIAKKGVREFWLHTTLHPYELQPPFLGAPYVCVILSCDESITSSDQMKLSETLVASNCRFMLAWGERASSWDDSVDWAFIGPDPNVEPQYDRAVMTTWHDGQTIADVIWQSLYLTYYSDLDVQYFLAVVVGENDDVEAKAIDAIRKMLHEMPT